MFTSQTFPPQDNPKLQPSLLPINAEIKVKSVLHLNQVLANLLDLESQYRVAHWNLSGIEFYFLHELFGNLYKKTGEYIDTIGELIRFYGGMATGTVRDSARDTKLPEFDISQFKTYPYLNQLCVAVATTVQGILIASADCQYDVITTNALIDLATGLSKDLYLLESHLR
jgi:starvation-inducible DNA-binding protein